MASKKVSGHQLPSLLRRDPAADPITTTTAALPSRHRAQ
jgi:hypothetical protein